MVYTVRQQHVVLPRVSEYAVQSLSSSIDVETTDVPGGGVSDALRVRIPQSEPEERNKSTMIARWNKALAAVAACALFAGGLSACGTGASANGDAENITLVVWASQED